MSSLNQACIDLLYTRKLHSCPVFIPSANSSRLALTCFTAKIKASFVSRFQFAFSSSGFPLTRFTAEIKALFVSSFQALCQFFKSCYFAAKSCICVKLSSPLSILQAFYQPAPQPRASFVSSLQALCLTTTGITPEIFPRVRSSSPLSCSKLLHS